MMGTVAIILALAIAAAIYALARSPRSRSDRTFKRVRIKGAKTNIFIPAHHDVIGDGAWFSPREQKRSARLRDYDEPMGM